MSERKRCPHCGETQYIELANSGYWWCANDEEGCGTSGPADDIAGEAWDALSDAVWGAREEIERLKETLEYQRLQLQERVQEADVFAKENEGLRKPIEGLREEIKRLCKELRTANKTAYDLHDELDELRAVPETHHVMCRCSTPHPHPQTMTGVVRDGIPLYLLCWKDKENLQFSDFRWLYRHRGELVVLEQYKCTKWDYETKSDSHVEVKETDGRIMYRHGIMPLRAEWLDDIREEWTPRKGDAVMGVRKR